MQHNQFKQLSKSIIVLSIGILFFIIALGNILNYETNFVYLKHIMQMDTLLDSNNQLYRAIDNPFIHHLTYIFIIACQCVVTLWLLYTGANCVLQIKNREQFMRHKNYAILGLTFAVMLYGFVFFTIAGEWYMSWQSPFWNAARASFPFLTYIFLALMYVSS